MAPNKFDNHIKSLLENREMQPSGAAWSKLSDRLDKDEKPNTKKWFWLSGLAASIIGVLLMINLSNSSKINPTIVNAEDIIIENAENIKKNILKNEDFQNTELVVESNIENEVVIPNVKAKKNASNIALNKKNKRQSINALSENNNINVVEDKSLIENKPLENTLVDSGIKVTKPQNSVLNEADKLLSEALLVVNTPKTETIDAASLLYDVEEEVEQSFRTKMFTKIKENVSTLTTVIVDRNK
ncbi:hypothetical protein [Aurantibacter sp.]|uniref:hypothetical protein n=1 Tax=Aurantibacter sp. TaxID=2807103 RepID=UPI0035C824E3